MSARRDFLDYREGLRRRLDRGAPAVTDPELRKLFALRDAWEEAYRRFPGGNVDGVAGGMSYVAQRPPSMESVEAEFGSIPRWEGLSKPRQRPPDPVPIDVAKYLQVELVKRQAASDRERGRFTLSAIMARAEATTGVRVTYYRIRRAEELVEAGWDLLRSHPDFSTDDLHVCWPNPDEVADLLG